MNNELYDDLALERVCKDRFGLDVAIDQVVVRDIEVGRVTKATVFLTKKKQLLVFVHSHSKLLLSDVKKIVARMGLKADTYLPPKHHPEYFDAIGRQKFREVFPGRGHITEQDIIFYRTLAPYNPALVLVSEVKNGEIYCYNSDAAGGWRVCAKFAYRRIKTS